METFRLISTSAERPREQRLAMGAVDVLITSQRLTFKSARAMAPRRPRDRQFSRRLGL
jgi:hypothetical protein